MAKPVSAFVESLLDLLGPLGEVHARRMFGGYGIYKDGLMFGLVADDHFYLKVDAESVSHFEQNACEPFVYEKSDGKSAKMSYYEPPEEAYSSPLKMKKWALHGWQAAQRAIANSPARKKRKSSSKSSD